LVAVAGLAILLFGLLTPTTTQSGGGMNGGSAEDKTSYPISNGILIMVGSFIIAAGLSFIAFKERYVPVEEEKHVTVKVEAETKENQVIEEKEQAGDEHGVPEEYLVILRLLSGDERHMFRTIADLGGEALQKDLIVRTKMSDAKVSRVIDRLIEKGLVTKERFGVTNKVRIAVEK